MMVVPGFVCWVLFVECGVYSSVFPVFFLFVVFGVRGVW